MSETVLEMTDVAVEYRRRGQRVRAVDGVDLTVARGEIVGLVGESGCGKSSLARAAVGLEPLAGGTVAFEGKPVTVLGRRRRPDYLRGLRAGADHVKVFVSGGLNRAGEDLWRPEMTDGEIRGAVRAAAEHDTYVVAHSGGSAVIRQALGQGVRCFEHIYSLDDETAALLARPGVFVTPTLCVSRSASWMRATGFPEASIERHLAAGEEHLASVRRAIRAGVTLVNGTDIPPGDPVDGTPAAVYELLMLASAGLSPLLSLQSASVHAAALCGIGDHVGQIRPGYAADFVAVAADPLADLEAMRTISLVVQGGRVVRDDAA